MLLKLDEEYQIVTSDKLNYSLEKFEETIDLKTKLPTGEKKWKVLGHYGFHLNHALKRYVTEKIRDEEKTSVHELIDKLSELYKHVDKVVKKENIIFVPKERNKND
jgi:hypothetical protein